MTEFAVELHHVSKTFSSRRGTQSEEVRAVRDMNLNIPPGEFFTLLGPSGCGKTTTLRLIAGFEVPTSGEVSIQGQSMTKIPPYRRPVNTVFQNYALFPHLNVAQNVGFGLAVKRVPRAERERRVAEALELVRLPGMGDRKPSQLSGGQQQRVALARALVNQPAVLLLDEPLGALDLKLRKAMQIELKHLQEKVGITFVYVTHDQEEALTMSDRIAVMNDGRILQVDGPVAIYEKPATRFVADFIGEINFLNATVEALDGGRVQVSVAGELAAAQAGDCHLTHGQSVTLTVRPEKLILARAEEPASEGLTGTVREAVYIGTDTRYIVELATGETVVTRVQNLGARGLEQFATGSRVKITWASEDAQALTD